MINSHSLERSGAFVRLKDIVTTTVVLPVSVTFKLKVCMPRRSEKSSSHSATASESVRPNRTFAHVTPPTAPAGTAGEYITVDKVSDPV